MHTAVREPKSVNIEGRDLHFKHVSALADSTGFLARIALYTEVDSQCDILAVDRHRYCQLSFTDDGPVYHAGCPPVLSQVTNRRYDDQLVVSKFSKSRVCQQNSRKKCIYFRGTQILLQHGI